MKILIDRLGINGEGVAKGTEGELLNKVCFVPGVLPNEQAEVSIVSDKKSYCVCKLDKLIISSESREIPPCKYFGVCGGCDLQHMNRKLQVDFKKDKVKETISKISKLDCLVSDTIRVNDYNYRNKMVFPIGTRSGKAFLGMFKQNSHNVVDIDGCLICKDIINKVYFYSKEFFEKSNFKGYDLKRKIGDIKYLVIRVVSDKILITIVSSKRVNLDEYYAYITKYFDNIGLSLLISNSDDEIMLGRYEYIAGIKSFEIEEFGVKYSIDNRSFLQVNEEIKTILYQKVLDEISEEDVVIDGYSGAGLLSAIIAHKCRQVIGIEINKSASNSAKQLAIDNNITNLECINGDVKDHIGQVLDKFDKCTIVLDPARSGCDSSVINCITSQDNLNKITKIIYVSCNPATIARDLSGLKEYYSVSKVIPLDMFPQTKHIETLVVMERKG